jgi:hypothetical protein
LQCLWTSFGFPVTPSLYLFRTVGGGRVSVHWVVVKSEIVHDTGAAYPCTLRRYPYHDWFITWIAGPSRPAELANRLQQAGLQGFRDELAPLLSVEFEL